MNHPPPLGCYSSPPSPLNPPLSPPLPPATVATYGTTAWLHGCCTAERRLPTICTRRGSTLPSSFGCASGKRGAGSASSRSSRRRAARWRRRCVRSHPPQHTLSPPALTSPQPSLIDACQPTPLLCPTQPLVTDGQRHFPCSCKNAPAYPPAHLTNFLRPLPLASLPSPLPSPLPSLAAAAARAL